MATATPTRPNPAVAQNAAVEQAISAAASKVRANDLFTGAAAAAVVFLGYLTVMVVLDNLFTLPDWVRMLGLVGLLGGLGAVAYFLVVRPLQRRVNPRYIARQIEATLPDAKNAVINWVDLQDENLPGSVKAAVGANAAEGVADADVDAATSSRKVMWLGGVAGGLVLVLAVLVLVFTFDQFLSHVKRAVVPFTPTPVATRTTIQLDEPTGGNVTLTDDQPLALAVTLGGRLPDSDGPDRVRLLVKYRDDAEFEPLRDDQGEPRRFTPAGMPGQYRLDLGRGTILNGFRYQVAAGDARTDEFEVKVVTRPMLTQFKATYRYPAYMKWEDTSTETSFDLRAKKGSVATLTMKANRSLDSATLVASAGNGGRIPAEVFGEARDRLRFTLPLQENGTYQIKFDPAGAEPEVTTPWYNVVVEPDHPPTVAITAPVGKKVPLKEPTPDGATEGEEPIDLPLNGLLAVDGTAADDHGLARLELRFKTADGRELKAKVYRDGKPLVREQDGTHLREILDYKDSVKLDALTDADGKRVVLSENALLEYWLLATDNCEPVANVTESARKTVRLRPAAKEPTQKQEQANKEQQRKQEEQKGEQKRDDQLKNEKRPEDQARNPDQNHQPAEQNPDGKDPNNDPMKGKGEKPPEGKPPEGDPNDPNKGGGETQPDPEQQKKIDETKRKIEEQKEQQKREGGDARGDGDKSEGKETPPSAEQKPQDGKQGGDGQKQAAEEKGGPPPEDMGKPEGKPGEGKDGGKLTDPQRSEPKPDPKPDAKGNDKPTDDKPKGAPKEGTEAGSSKESKEEPAPKPTNPNEKPDGKPGDKKDGSASAGRGTEPPPDPSQKPENTGTQKPDEKKVDPKDLSGSKPKGEPTRGDTKPEPKKNDAGGTDTKPEQKPDPKQDAGGAKGEAPTPKAESKDAPPKGDGTKPMPPKNPPPADACNEKEAPKPGSEGNKENPSEAKGEGKKQEKPAGGTDPKTPPEGGGKTEDDKGATKPSNTDPPKKGEGGGKPDPKDPTKGDGTKPDPNDPKTQPQGGGKGEQKLDPKEMEQAVKDLDSKDEKTKQAAQEKLDKAVGKENREQMEKLQKDLKSDDKATREAAEKKLEEMKKEAEKNAKGDGSSKPQELTEEQKKELTEAAKNLDSKDPQTKKEAQEKLDKAVGKENREAIEKMQKDLKSDDKATREAAEKKLEEMAKEAQKNAQKGEKPRDLTDAEKKDLADAAKNLNSKDEKARQEAEKKLDEAIGKQNREELQQDMKDLTGDDPQKAEQAREKLQKKIDEAKKNGDGKHDDKDGKLGGGNSKKPGKPIEANLENQLKAGELTLDDFKKYRGDKKFLKENNWTEAEYERFLKQEEARLQKLRDELAAERLNPTTDPTGTPTIRNDFSGDRVKGRTDGGAVGGSGGPPVAPPGFAEAQKRFAEEAAKRDKNKK